MINESLKSAREFAQKNQIPESIFLKFNWIDFTTTKKYIHQMLKWYISNNEIELLDRYYIRSLLIKYDNVIGKAVQGQIEDLDTFDEFEEFVESNTSKRFHEKEEYKKNIIMDNDKILIIRPEDKATVCKYGKNTQWCITMTDDEVGDDDHYNRYRFQGGYTFYYCILKDITVLDGLVEDEDHRNALKKICLLVGPDGLVEDAYDSTDEIVSEILFDQILNKCGVIDHRIFKAVAISQEERIKRILDSVDSSHDDNGYIINGDLDFSIFEGEGEIKTLPIKLKQVNGSIYAVSIGLESMENFPTKCTGIIALADNHISNFPEGLESYRSIDLSGNELTSTKNVPKISESLFLHYTNSLKKLESLEQQSFHVLNVSYTGLESLIGSPDVLNYYCSFTSIKSLDGVKLVQGLYYTLDFSGNKNLENIEILRTIPDTTQIEILKLDGCPKLSKEYIKEILKDKKVKKLVC